MTEAAAQGESQRKEASTWKSYPAYKDSGVEWLGKVPAHWEVIPLKRRACSIKDGTHGTFERVLDGIPLLSAKNVGETGDLRVSDAESLIDRADYNEINRSGYLKVGDLLLTIVGTIGRAAVFDWSEPVAFQRSVAVIRPNSSIDVRLLFFLSQANYFQHILRTRSKQSAQGGVYLGEVATIPIVVPLRAEQFAITSFLDRETAKIDALVAKKERLIELLQEKRAALITHAVTKGLDPTVPMQDPGIEWLGQIPAHWEVKRLKFSADLQTGLTLGKNYTDRKTELRPYLRVANVQDGYLDLKDIAEVICPLDEIQRYELLYGDVLMTEGGDFDKLGRGYLWEDQIEGCLHQNHIFAVRPDHKVLEPRYLAALMTSSHGKDYFTSTSQQTTNLATTNATKLKSFPLLLPPFSEQKSILVFLNNGTAKLDALIAKVHEGIEKLKEYRTALISAAVTGKIDVREAT